MANGQTPLSYPPLQPKGLEPADYTRQRDQAIAEAVKGLFIINGGAAVALLAFFKDVWEEQPALAAPMLKAISVLVLGVALAGGVHLIKYQASWVYQGEGPQEGFWLRRTYLLMAGLSLCAFVAAMVLMIGGMWSEMLSAR